MLGGFASSGVLRVAATPPEETIVYSSVGALDGRTVSVGVTTSAGIPGSNEYDFLMTLNGSPVTPNFFQPSRYDYEVPDSASSSLVEWSIEVDSVEVDSGSISVPANLTVPAAFTAGQWQLTDDTAPATVPDAFGSTDWTLVEATVAATVPAAFVAGDWVLEPAVNDPPPGGGDGSLTAPTSVAAATQSDRVVRISWSPPSTGTPTSYEVDYSTDAATWTTATAQTSPANITVPTGGQLYYFRVRARNATTSATSGNVTATTQVRPYGISAEWNLPISQLLSRGTHQNETYIRDVLWLGNEGPGNGPQTGTGISWCNFFSRDYTYPVYRSTDNAGNFATVSAGDGNFRTGQIPWNPAWVIPAGTDGQIIVVDETTGAEWNGFQCTYNSGPNTLTATRVNRVTVNADGTGGAANYRTKTSGFRQSRGCGIQYLAMLITPQEIAQGKIYHALSMVMRRSGYRYYSVPATKGERYPGNELDQGVPQGTRFYLDITDAEIDAHVASWPAGVPTSTRNTMRIVFKAMQEYGWIATDQGGDNHIQFQHSASAVWDPYGIESNFTASNGKTYPRDAIDGLITNKAKIRVVRPADGVLHYYEAGGDNPRQRPVALVGGPFPFRTPTGSIEQRVITDIGRPFIERSGTTITLTRRAQFFGQNPVTTNAVSWRRNGAEVSTGGTFYNTSGVAGTYTAVESASDANGTTSITSNSITI